ncbi:hypothetical protein VNO77_20664 [Canavalia gladiata]|uniref:Uncharacterized protein n=1 Tax=Canavalia gladiata TaxID=3824 RepID=A0AAN9LPW5_CANGL
MSDIKLFRVIVVEFVYIKDFSMTLIVYMNCLVIPTSDPFSFLINLNLKLLVSFAVFYFFRGLIILSLIAAYPLPYFEKFGNPIQPSLLNLLLSLQLISELNIYGRF